MNSNHENSVKKDTATIAVRLPREIADRLEQFRIEHGLTADTVVERALREYFREGDMSH